MDGMAVTTSEGIGNREDGYHPVRPRPGRLSALSVSPSTYFSLWRFCMGARTA
jgi:hypothetical protein